MVSSHSPNVSRRSSPRGFVGEGVIGNLNTRSVPATPLGTVPNGTSTGVGSKSGTPALPMGQEQSPFVGLGGGGVEINNLSNLNNRFSGASFEAPSGYGLQHGMEDRVRMIRVLLILADCVS